MQKRTFSSRAASVLLIAFALAGLSCGDSGGGSGPTGPTQRQISRIVVSPGSVSARSLGGQIQFAAQALDGNGQAVGGVTLSWSSANPAIAEINSSSGLATVRGNGSTTITARASGASGSATVSVSQVLATIEIQPSVVQLEAVGDTVRLSAEAKDSAGYAISDVSPSWSSSRPDVAEVDPTSGLLTATGPGAASIVASALGIADTASVSVDYRGSSVILDLGSFTPPDFTSLLDSAVVSARVLDGDGSPVEGAVIEWSSSDEGVVRLDPVEGGDEGEDRRVLVPIADGTSTIRVRYEEADLVLEDSVEVSVEIPGVPPLVTILSPGIGEEFQEGVSVTLRASAVDQEDGTLPGASIRWSSDLEGELGVGDALTLTSLGVGTHQVWASATDSHGRVSTDLSVVRIVPGDPEAEIRQGSINLPEGSRIDAATLKVTSIQGAAGVDSEGGFAAPMLAGPTELLIATDSAGTPVLASLSAGSSSPALSARSTARVLLAISRGLFIPEDPEPYLNALDADVRANALTAAIENGLLAGRSLADMAPELEGILGPSGGAASPSIPYEDVGAPGVRAELVPEGLQLSATTPVSFAVRIFDEEGRPVSDVMPTFYGGVSALIEPNAAVEPGTFFLPGMDVGELPGEGYVAQGEPTPVTIPLEFTEEFERLTIIARSARELDGEGFEQLEFFEWSGLQLSAFRRARNREVARAFLPLIGIGPACMRIGTSLVRSEWLASVQGVYPDWKSIPTEQKRAFWRRVGQRATATESTVPAVAKCLVTLSTRLAKSTPLALVLDLIGRFKSIESVAAAFENAGFVNETEPRFDACIGLQDPLDPGSNRFISDYRCLKLDVSVTPTEIEAGTPLAFEGTYDVQFVARPVVEESAYTMSAPCLEPSAKCGAEKAEVTVAIPTGDDSKLWANVPYEETVSPTLGRIFPYNPASGVNWTLCSYPRTDQTVDYDEKGVGCQRWLMGSPGEHRMSLLLTDANRNVMDRVFVTAEAADPDQVLKIVIEDNLQDILTGWAVVDEFTATGGTPPYAWSFDMATPEGWTLSPFGDGQRVRLDGPAHEQTGYYITRLRVEDATGASATALYGTRAHDLRWKDGSVISVAVGETLEIDAMEQVELVPGGGGNADYLTLEVFGWTPMSEPYAHGGIDFQRLEEPGTFLIFGDEKADLYAGPGLDVAVRGGNVGESQDDMVGRRTLRVPVRTLELIDVEADFAGEWVFESAWGQGPNQCFLFEVQTFGPGNTAEQYVTVQPHVLNLEVDDWNGGWEGRLRVLRRTSTQPFDSWTHYTRSGSGTQPGCGGEARGSGTLLAGQPAEWDQFTQRHTQLIGKNPYGCSENNCARPELEMWIEDGKLHVQQEPTDFYQPDLSFPGISESRVWVYRRPDG